MMIRYSGLRCAMLGLALSLCGMLAPAEDWPNWRGPRHDGLSRETGLLKSWPAEGPKVIWKVDLGPSYSSFAIADGRVFTQYQAPDGQYLIALDEKTGDKLWQFKTGEPWKNGEYNGPRATPTVDGALVYAMDAFGNLVCAEAATGKEVWRHDTLKEYGAKNLQWGISCSPFITEGKVYVNIGAPGASVIAFDKQTGKEVWKALDDKAGYSTAAEGKMGGVRQIVFFTEAGAVGLTPEDGKLVWRYPWKTSYGINAATPLIQGDQVFITSGYNSGCALLSVQPQQDPPVKQLYKNKNLRGQVTTPVLVDGHLYGLDDKDFRCLTYDNGSVKWSEPVGERAQFAVADGMLYVQTEKGGTDSGEADPRKMGARLGGGRHHHGAARLGGAGGGEWQAFCPG